MTDANVSQKPSGATTGPSAGRRSRNKGKRGEREAAGLIAEALGVVAQRGYHQARGGQEAPDVVVEGAPLWVEVKRQKRPNIPAAIAQAVAERGSRPVWAVALTKADRGEWLVTMTIEDWLDLLREWKAGR